MPIARVSIYCIFRACTLRTLTSVCQFVRTCHCPITDDRTLSLKSTRTLAHFSIVIVISIVTCNLVAKFYRRLFIYLLV